MAGLAAARVAAVQASPRHKLGKDRQTEIKLVAGFGVEGDAHAGALVQHIYDKRKNPKAPNLRQVHLMPVELFEELAAKGFDIHPGQMGENITTAGLDLIALPRASRLLIGEAVIEVTGLRAPCSQLDKLAEGLAFAMIAKGADGKMAPRCGVMGVILEGGVVAAGDEITVTLPNGEHLPLRPV